MSSRHILPAPLILNRSKWINFCLQLSPKFQSSEMTPTLKILRGVRVVIYEYVTLLIRQYHTIFEVAY